MSLQLFHGGPGANSLKPLLTLYEKGLDFTRRQLNPAVFEHHEDAEPPYTLCQWRLV